MEWYLSLKTTCDHDAGIPVTDADIETAPPFEGWSEYYMSWPENLWYNPNAKPFKVPCMDLGMNAYHIKKLAEAMEKNRSWIGNPLELQGSRIVDGNHRVRAAKYLHAKGVKIPEPIIKFV